MDALARRLLPGSAGYRGVFFCDDLFFEKGAKTSGSRMAFAIDDVRTDRSLAGGLGGLPAALEPTRDGPLYRAINIAPLAPLLLPDRGLAIDISSGASRAQAVWVRFKKDVYWVGRVVVCPLIAALVVPGG